MEYLPHLALASAALLVALAIWRALGGRLFRPAPPYTRRPSLLTAGEIRFYRTLVHAVPPGLLVMVKVRLMDVVDVPAESWREYGALGSGMHCDFVLADPGTLEPVLVIELDDRSHAGESARKRDSFKDAAVKAAGVPILRVRVARGYDEGELRRRVEGAVGKGGRIDWI